MTLPSPPPNSLPTDSGFSSGMHGIRREERKRLPLTQLSRDDRSSSTQLYSVQEMLNMNTYVSKKKKARWVLVLLFKRSTICSHLTSRLFTSLSFPCQNVSFTYTPKDEKAPDHRSFTTPAAHMRHHGGCDKQQIEDNRRSNDGGLTQNIASLASLLRTGVA